VVSNRSDGSPAGHTFAYRLHLQMSDFSIRKFYSLLVRTPECHSEEYAENFDACVGSQVKVRVSTWGDHGGSRKTWLSMWIDLLTIQQAPLVLCLTQLVLEHHSRSTKNWLSMRIDLSAIPPVPSMLCLTQHVVEDSV
jgi:hypothetical protein